ncbi:MAG: hypothetical protein DWQ01_00120 [Planctomycetota bacterium]|nr:MAG: hypothetical protein DWQ01_00120 [Planctomycetota bacterium]
MTPPWIYKPGWNLDADLDRSVPSFLELPSLRSIHRTGLPCAVLFKPSATPEETSEELPEEPSLRSEPVVLEDLVAAVRLPHLLGKLQRVLTRCRNSFQFPLDYPMVPLPEGAGEGWVDYGMRWADRYGSLLLFAGLSWGQAGHDPVWEVRLQALPGFSPDSLRQNGLHRAAARMAEGHFQEWDRFWHEDRPGETLLLGCSAAATRFLEEPDPDATAADYLAGALYALFASGALKALVDIVCQGRENA